MPTRCNRGFLLQILLLAQHVSGTTVPIIRSSRVLYSGCCLWYFVLLFSSCWSGVELRVMCPVCRMLQHPANLVGILFPHINDDARSKSHQKPLLISHVSLQLLCMTHVTILQSVTVLIISTSCAGSLGIRAAGVPGRG